MSQKSARFFGVLLDASDKQRLAILKTVSDSQLRSLLEAIYNVLKGNCPIGETTKRGLSRYKKVLRRLVSKEFSLNQKRRLLIKHHRILPLILKPVTRYLLRDGSIRVRE